MHLNTSNYEVYYLKNLTRPVVWVYMLFWLCCDKLLIISSLKFVPAALLAPSLLCAYWLACNLLSKDQFMNTLSTFTSTLFPFKLFITLLTYLLNVYKIWDFHNTMIIWEMMFLTFFGRTEKLSHSLTLLYIMLYWMLVNASISRELQMRGQPRLGSLSRKWLCSRYGDLWLIIFSCTMLFSIKGLAVWSFLNN